LTNNAYPKEYIENRTNRQRIVASKYKLYRTANPIAVDGKICIIVDDGIATETPNAKHCDAEKKSCKNNSCGSRLPYDSLKIRAEYR
jgi:predicted phosphoribosyltransferase